MKRQRGLMLLEIMISIMIFTTMGILVMNSVARRAHMAEYDIAVQEARVIAGHAELYRQQVTSSTPGAFNGGGWTINFATQSDYLSVPDFSALIDTPLPAQTPWGTPYEIRGDGVVATVRYTVSADYQNVGRAAPAAGTIAVNPDGTAVVTIQAIKGTGNQAHIRSLRLKTTSFGQDNRS